MNSPAGFHREGLPSILGLFSMWDNVTKKQKEVERASAMYKKEDVGQTHSVNYADLKRAYNQVQMMKQAGVFDAALEKAEAYDKKLQIEYHQQKLRELEGSL